MSFIFPATVKHLPNNDQLMLLTSLLSSDKYPGFLHTSVLNLNYRNGLNEIQTMDSKTLRDVIQRSGYLFVPFSEPITYIMMNYYDVIGFITPRNLITYEFENPVSLGEIATAEKYRMPIVNKFVNIGVSKLCRLCGGGGVLDWVNDIKFSSLYKKVPDKRYILAINQHIYLLIDNHKIHSYDGKDIIRTCPRCLGSGMGGVLVRVGDCIKMINFYETNHDSFSIVSVRSNLFETPEDRYYNEELV